MKRTHEDAEKTRLSIVDAALKVFLEMGYSRAKISDICRVANVTRGAVYWYFRNKEDILLYLADSLAHEIEQKINESFEQGTTNFEKTEIRMSFTMPPLNLLKAQFILRMQVRRMKTKQ